MGEVVLDGRRLLGLREHRFQACIAHRKVLALLILKLPALQYILNWVGDAPGDYIRTMMRAIVGIEISIERMEGRLKASQVEDHADRLGTVEGLLQAPDSQSHAMADLVRKEIGKR